MKQIWKQQQLHAPHIACHKVTGWVDRRKLHVERIPWRSSYEWTQPRRDQEGVGTAWQGRRKLLRSDWWAMELVILFILLSFWFSWLPSNSLCLTLFRVMFDVTTHCHQQYASAHPAKSVSPISFSRFLVAVPWTLHSWLKGWASDIVGRTSWSVIVIIIAESGPTRMLWEVRTICDAQRRTWRVIDRDIHTNQASQMQKPTLSSGLGTGVGPCHSRGDSAISNSRCDTGGYFLPSDCTSCPHEATNCKLHTRA